MDIVLTRKYATCVVKCPWEPMAKRNDKYARIYVSDGSNKRQRGKSGRRETCCTVHATVWNILHYSSGAKNKAFRRESSSKCLIPGWDSSTLLAVNDALDSSLFLSATWVLVCLSRKEVSHGLGLLRFTKQGIQLDTVFRLEQAPLQGVVLRGPQILCSTSSKVILVRKDGMFPMDYLASDCLDSSAVERCLCIGERDREGVLITLDPNAPRSEVLRMFIIDVARRACEESWASEYTGKTIAGAAISFRRGILALCESDGSVKTVDVKSGKVAWEALAAKDMGKPCGLAFFRDELLISELDSEAVWGVSFSSTPSYGNGKRARLLFPDQCSVIGSQSHGHFFAPWRGSLLQCSDENGTHCVDKDLTPIGDKPANDQMQDTSFMLAVMKNLEHRLDVGVQRVTKAAQKREDKANILDHVRSLLRSADGVSPCRIYRPLFRGSLESVVELPERRRSITEGHGAEAETDVNLNGSRIMVDGQAQSERRPRFVRLVSSVAGVDKTRNFIVIRVQVSVLGTKTSDKDNPTPGLGIQLNVQFSRSLSTIWDVQNRVGLSPGAIIWLHACAPLSAVVSDSTANVMDLSIIVRVDADDGRSQLLGKFCMSTILSCSTQIGVSSGDDCDLIEFEKNIHAIAQGPSAHLLQCLVHPGSHADGFKITVREGLACIAFKVKTKVELALAIAKLRACSADEVRLRSSSQLSRESLRLVDVSTRALEKEMELIRNIGSRRDEVGYDMNRLVEILRCQMALDDLFGRVEEQFLGT